MTRKTPASAMAYGIALALLTGCQTSQTAAETTIQIKSERE